MVTPRVLRSLQLLLWGLQQPLGQRTCFCIAAKACLVVCRGCRQAVVLSGTQSMGQVPEHREPALCVARPRLPGTERRAVPSVRAVRCSASAMPEAGSSQTTPGAAFGKCLVAAELPTTQQHLEGVSEQ